MVELRDASTVLILREIKRREGEEPFEVFMLRRHGGHEFMANVWVFPGGRLEERDISPAVFDLVEGLDGQEAQRRMGWRVDEERALGLYVAAVRETFEEAGLLLARRPGAQRLIDLSKPDVAARAEELRELVDRGEIGMVEVCEELGVVLCGREFGFYAHWVTPFFESRRYDTRFFVARAPRAQVASHDDGETVDGGWWTPSAALRASERGELLISPPTIRSLQDLREFSSVQAALDSTEGKVPPRILPAFEIEGDEVTLLLPGDKDFPTDDERYADTDPVEGVTRMVMKRP